MYPQPELNRLAARRAALRCDIAARRVACAEAAAQAVRPLEWLDRAVAFWRRFTPLARFASVPLGLLITRTVFPRHGLAGSLVRWASLVAGAAGGIRSAIGTGFGSGRS